MNTAKIIGPADDWAKPIIAESDLALMPGPARAKILQTAQELEETQRRLAGDIARGRELQQRHESLGLAAENARRAFAQIQDEFAGVERDYHADCVLLGERYSAERGWRDQVAVRNALASAQSLLAAKDAVIAACRAKMEREQAAFEAFLKENRDELVARGIIEPESRKRK
jgi:hypothetical protein